MSAPQVAVPTTRAQLEALGDRRSELAGQLGSLSETGLRLSSERREAAMNQNRALVASLDERIAQNSARIARIEGEKLALDDAIAAGITRVAETENAGLLAGEIAPPPAFPGVSVPPFDFPRPPLFDRGPDPARIALLGSFTLITLALIAWRWASGRQRDRLKSQQISGESQATKDLRVAVETIAVEVERISENQRFITKLLAEKQKDAALLERPGGDRP